MQNHICTVAHHDNIDIKRCGILLRIFWYMWKVCRILSPYQNAYAKVKKWIFNVWFPGNCFEFDMILNDFWSSTIWTIQIKISFPRAKNPKNPGIQLIHVTVNFWHSQSQNNWKLWEIEDWGDFLSIRTRKTAYIDYRNLRSELGGSFEVHQIRKFFNQTDFWQVSSEGFARSWSWWSIRFNIGGTSLECIIWFGPQQNCNTCIWFYIWSVAV